MKCTQKFRVKKQNKERFLEGKQGSAPGIKDKKIVEEKGGENTGQRLSNEKKKKWRAREKRESEE